MTDFGLSGGYKVYDRLDQGEVFSPLLWRIFYDPLLCKIKRHEQLCKYWIDTKFVSKSGRIESSGGLTSYFSAGAFVDDMIWVGNCQASIQYALNIVSEFFVINNISINSEKTVAILINQGVKVALLSICSQPISIAKKEEAHWYLGIFLSTEGLSKPSVAKAYANVHFFVNVVLRKAITNKQFSYLVLAVLQPIISYCIQFSFVSFNVCCKWDVLIRKGLRSKACLFRDFLDTALHHPSLYNMKLFEQMQSEGKIAALIVFSNAFGILGHLFRHRFLDLQRLDLHSPVPHWFLVSSEFLKSQSCSFFGSIGSAEKLGLDILEFGEFSAVKDRLHNIWSGFFEVFTDGFLRNAGSAEVICGAAAYFPVLDKSIGVAVSGLLSFTMTELQTVTLALECVPSLNTVVLRFDSQAAIDACVSEMSLVTSDFRNQCWLERHHIFNLVKDKDLSVSWVKVKGHSGIPGNMEADLAAGAASGSPFFFCGNVCEHFLVAEGIAVSGNVCHFVRDIFWSVCCARWEAGPGCDIIPDAMIGCIDWVVMVKVWHLDSHMLTGFTSQVSLMLYTYIMKAVHRRLPVVVRKKLYNKHYPNVLCLFCSGVEFSDHIFTCVHKSGICGKILAEASARWSALAGSFSASAVLQVLSQCSIDVGLYTLVATTQIVDYVRFVVELHHAKVWLARASHWMVMEKAGLVCDSGVVSGLSRGVSLVLSDGVVKLLGVADSFAVHAKVWLARASHWVVMEKAGLVCDSGVVSGLSRGVSSVLSDGVVKLLGVTDFFAVSFGCQKPYCFFSGLGGSVWVIIGV
ncbi:hypothetical protein G9A89_014734 [Geosiphon pyriformis]|nr:hypothetical protein G9A89_014734 [Geosiphon pyriformis]